MRFLTSLGLIIAVAAQAGAAEPTVRALAAGEILRGRFVQERHLQGFAAPVRSEGRFSVVAGEGLIWQVETPFRVTTVMTRRGVAQTTEGAETLRLTANRIPAMARLYETLAGALAGNWQGLEASFAVTRRAEADGEHLSVVPKDSSDLNAIASIAVRLRGFVERIEISRLSGDTDVIVFTDQAREIAAPRSDEAALLGALGR